MTSLWGFIMYSPYGDHKHVTSYDYESPDSYSDFDSTSEENLVDLIKSRFRNWTLTLEVKDIAS